MPHKAEDAWKGEKLLPSNQFRYNSAAFLSLRQQESLTSTHKGKTTKAIGPLRTELLNLSATTAKLCTFTTFLNSPSYTEISYTLLLYDKTM